MYNPFSYTKTKNKIGKLKVEISFHIFSILLLSNISGQSTVFKMIH